MAVRERDGLRVGRRGAQEGSTAPSRGRVRSMRPVFALTALMIAETCPQSRSQTAPRLGRFSLRASKLTLEPPRHARECTKVSPIAIGLERQVKRRRNPSKNPIRVRAHFVFSLARDCREGFGIELIIFLPLALGTNDSGRKILSDALLHRMDRLQNFRRIADAGLDLTS